MAVIVAQKSCFRFTVVRLISALLSAFQERDPLKQLWIRKIILIRIC